LLTFIAMLTLAVPGLAWQVSQHLIPWVRYSVGNTKEEFDVKKSIHFLVALLLLTAAVRGDGRPGDDGAVPPVEANFSKADYALLAGFGAALHEDEIGNASREHLLRQLRLIPPVAFVDGYWATPVDVSQLLQVPVIRQGVESSLMQAAEREPVVELLNDPNRLKQVAAFAFSAHPLRQRLELPYVGDFARVSVSQAETAGVFIAPVKDVEWVVAERVPPLPATEAELECYFFCGDPESWDFDADGRPNVRDGDDDDDGVADHEDAYPYWPGGSTCPCADRDFVGFTEKFSAGITRSAAGGPVDLKFVVPAAATLDENAPQLARCPDSGDPATRYVSADPADCARLRFRCLAGEIPFSNECGCGCTKD
jgi:hypothetical protein